MFAGYGGSLFALDKAKIEHKCIGYSEIDKYAIICFNNNHPNVKNYGDCKLINPNEIEDFDLLTGGFPCQSFSNAGKQLGELDTRGTLFYEIIRIAEVKKPKYMLLENVKGLTAKKFKDTFDKILSELDRIGYNVYWKVLNSKDFGIPQSRARIWFVCFRKDIDKGTFKFPEQEELKIRLKDILEENVDEKYYLSEKMVQGIMKSHYMERKPMKDLEVCKTLKVGGDTPCLYPVGSPESGKPHYLQLDKGNHSQMDRVYFDDSVSPTLNGSINIKTRDVEQAIDIAQELANKEEKPVQIDLMHLQHGEIRPLSTYIPQDLDVHRCLQAGEPKEVVVEPNVRRCPNCNVILEEYQDY
jgi:DNA (cytosine-5)-methyltransferase 1